MVGDIPGAEGAEDSTHGAGRSALSTPSRCPSLPSACVLVAVRPCAKNDRTDVLVGSQTGSRKTACTWATWTRA